MDKTVSVFTRTSAFSKRMYKFTSSIHKSYWCTWEKSEPKLDPVYADRALLVLSISSGHIRQVRQTIAWKKHSYCPVNLTAAKWWEIGVFFLHSIYKSKICRDQSKMLWKRNHFPKWTLRLHFFNEEGIDSILHSLPTPPPSPHYPHLILWQSLPVKIFQRDV